MTFDIVAQTWISQGASWQDCYEIFCNCRQCHLPTTFLVVASGMEARERFSRGDGLATYHSGINEYFTIDRFISIRDIFSTPPPEHLPDDIKNAFLEGAACLSIECFNAAATMFRLCVDLATRPLLPDPDDKTKPEPTAKQRRDLGLRLPWLFDNGLLPSELRELAGCVREDGNDGAHVGNLSKADADDLVDFTTRLLDRLVSEPKRLKLAQERRAKRREPKT